MPGTKVLILTVHDSDELIHELCQAGAHGYIRKSESDRELISAIKTLVTNKTFYPPVTPTDTHRSLKPKRRNAQPRLTTRQKEVVKFLAEGFSSAKIGKTLGITRKTVETHRQNMLSTTNSRSTAELVRYAIRNGIIEA
jgi:DNA-binding NarL/FixJ family response regulator